MNADVVQLDPGPGAVSTRFLLQSHNVYLIWRIHLDHWWDDRYWLFRK